MKPLRLLLACALSFAALALIVPAVSAHPLGNFTINHYSGLRVSPSGVIVDHVMDFAEIPTFTERRTMDTNGDGTVSDAESHTYALAKCNELNSDLDLEVGGTRATLTLTQLGISFPMGQGNPTMRLVCIFTAPIAGLQPGTTITFSDNSYQSRQGWREITVNGDGATITSSDAPTTSASNRLTYYPPDLISVPLGQGSTTFTVSPGGATLPAFSVPDAAPLNGAQAAPVVSDTTAAVPASVDELGSDVTSLFDASDLTPPVIVLSLLAAAALGALHAVSPGHGKTVMAAYLVGSRGNLRQAVGLGLTVTVSHTIGVLALGLLSLSAAFVIPADKLYPLLSVGSGAIVVIIGFYLLFTRLRTWRTQSRERAHAEHVHEAAHGHDHEHEPGHDHHQESPQEHPEGWHEHGGMGHTHIPQQQQMGKRGLFALGLSGGMIPSVSALLVLIGSISIGRPAWGVVLTISFGLGMAAVLVGIGLALVYARRFVERFPQARAFDLGRRIPVLSAVVVLAAGALIAGQGLLGLGL